MNESNVIILFVAANPSKDITRARKIILRKKEEPESVERSFGSDPTKINTTFKKCKCQQAANGSISMKAVKLEIGVLRPEARGCEAGGKRKKEGARRSVFTNMRCSRCKP
ncbi:hypothetical protein QUB05_09805 [Microcoleus sp. F10-C6]|uniref:hypothetical protein n=1 Tax=unclassified Microcoleus TaxID=2642155 RepID=UPI002FD2BB2C